MHNYNREFRVGWVEPVSNRYTWRDNKSARTTKVDVKLHRAAAVSGGVTHRGINENVIPRGRKKRLHPESD